MATYTLTQGSPEQIFNIASDGSVQVIISSESVMDGKFILEYETAVASTYIPVPDTESDTPYSRIYTFKAGNLKCKVKNPNERTNIVVDVK